MLCSTLNLLTINIWMHFSGMVAHMIPKIIDILLEGGAIVNARNEVEINLFIDRMMLLLCILRVNGI